MKKILLITLIMISQASNAEAIQVDIWECTNGTQLTLIHEPRSIFPYRLWADDAYIYINETTASTLLSQNFEALHGLKIQNPIGPLSAIFEFNVRNRKFSLTIEDNSNGSKVEAFWCQPHAPNHVTANTLQTL